jgi:hypothetical protein
MKKASFENKRIVSFGGFKMNERPVNQEINLTFFKESGKYYTSGKAYVSHWQFEEEYKQDIVNTQNAMMEGWQGNYFLVTSSDDDAEGFHEGLYKPSEFIGFNRK